MDETTENEKPKSKDTKLTNRYQYCERVSYI
jgi:hypothetical protein